MGAGLLQPTHIIFVIVIALLVFGPKRLPEMGRSIGHGIREFKDSMDGNGNDPVGRRITRPSPATCRTSPSGSPRFRPRARRRQLPPPRPPSAPAAARTGSSVSR